MTVSFIFQKLLCFMIVSLLFRTFMLLRFNITIQYIHMYWKNQSVKMLFSKEKHYVIDRCCPSIKIITKGS